MSSKRQIPVISEALAKTMDRAVANAVRAVLNTGEDMEFPMGGTTVLLQKVDDTSIMMSIPLSGGRTKDLKGIGHLPTPEKEIAPFFRSRFMVTQEELDERYSRKENTIHEWANSIGAVWEIPEPLARKYAEKAYSLPNVALGHTPPGSRVVDFVTRYRDEIVAVGIDEFEPFTLGGAFRQVVGDRTPLIDQSRLDLVKRMYGAPSGFHTDAFSDLPGGESNNPLGQFFEVLEKHFSAQRDGGSKYFAGTATIAFDFLMDFLSELESEGLLPAPSTSEPIPEPEPVTKPKSKTRRNSAKKK